MPSKRGPHKKGARKKLRALRTAKVIRFELTIASASTAVTAAPSSAAATTTSTMAATSTAPSSTMTTAVPSASATTTASALALRTSFIHDQRAAKEILAIQRLNRFFRVRVVANFGEAEPPRLPGKSITQKRERIRLHSDFRK
jgi:hypothetical protein